MSYHALDAVALAIDAPVTADFCFTREFLRDHVHAFLMCHNFAKRLKILRRLTPYEDICKVWTKQSKRFKLNPLHDTLGLNT